MDLTKLLSRLRDQRRNKLLLYAKGQLISRTFAEVHADVIAACEKLSAIGVKPGMRIGIRARNGYEWIVYDLALIELRATSIAFTDDFAQAPVGDLFEKYSLSLLLTDRNSCPKDETIPHPIIFIDDPDDNFTGAIAARELAVDENFTTPALIFSSGSAGGLKGLVLNRFGIEASVDAFARVVGPRPDDLFLLFLPMSNYQQRMMYYAAFWYGFDLIVTDPTQLFRALKHLHPTILIAPPALYEGIETQYDSQPAWKRRLAGTAANVALLLPHSALRKAAARAIFKRVHEALGGRMRFMVTGMAPIKRSALKLFERMQLPLFETYGLIECGSISLNLPDASRLGSVGRLLPGVKVEIAGDGEIIARRDPPIAIGYFECAEGENERTFLGNNRIATGDIGFFDNDHYLYLVGRKKEVIITSGGEKIHPEVLESEIDACPDVGKSVVLPGSNGSPLTALVLPKNPQDALARARIEQFVQKMQRGRSSPGIGKLIFTDIRFSTDNGFLRPNLKLDRRNIARHFGGVAEAETSTTQKARHASHAG